MQNKKKKEVNKEIAELSDLKVFSETEGAKKLIATSKQITLGVIGTLANQYKELSHIELVTLCATLKANLDMYQLLTGIDDQIKQIEGLFSEEESEH